MSERTVLSIIIVSAVLIFSCGCNVPRQQLRAYDSYFETADFNSAFSFADKKINKKRKNPDGDDLLWTLQAAAAKRCLQDYNTSTQYFDIAEEQLQYFDLRADIADGLAAVAINDNALPYKGYQYDGVMVNVYKALNFMAENELELARVELNRALDRQRRAKEKLENEISSAKSRIEKMQYGSLVNQTLSNPTLEQSLHSKYPELYEYQPYKNYVNPFVPYLASIYFSATGETAAARDLLKEVYGLVPENKFIEEEFQQIEQLLDENKTVENTVWIIFENGLGPIKDEFRIDLPLFIATNRVFYAGIALPKLQFRQQAAAYLKIEADGNSLQTATVASLDRVINGEFRKDFQEALIRAILSTTAKVAAQYALTEQDSTAANLAAAAVAIYSLATTAADVRIWSALPKNFQIARLARPGDNIIKIYPPMSEYFEVKLPDCKNAIIYVKIIKQNTKPIYEVIAF